MFSSLFILGNFYSIELGEQIFIIICFLSAVVLASLFSNFFKGKSIKETTQINVDQLIFLSNEFDSNPAIRVNASGDIISSNLAGSNFINKLLLGAEDNSENKGFTQHQNPSFFKVSLEQDFFELLNSSVKSYNIKSLLGELSEINFTDIINDNKVVYKKLILKNYNVKIIIKGFSRLNFAHISFINQTDIEDLKKQLSETKTNFKKLTVHLQKYQELEMQKISRELHDGLGQQLTSIRLNIEYLKDHFDKEKLDAISEQLIEAMNEVKSYSHRLKPRVLDDFGLIPSLRSLCNKYARESSIKGNFQTIKLKNRLPADLEVALYRIAQESLTNIVKHSRAKEFSLQLLQDKNILRMMIEDDGVGFDINEIKNDPKKKNCMGLMNIKDRVLAFDGELTIDSSKNHGTEIIVEIPLENTK